MFSQRKKNIWFTGFLVLYLLGLLLLGFVGVDGSGRRGFLASLFSVAGLVGIFCVLLIRPDSENPSRDSEES
jgi:sugar phosphate permease